MRERHGADFRRFRTRVAELAASVRDLEDVEDPQALAHHIEVRYHDTVAAELQELRELLRAQRFDYVDAATSFAVVPPDSVLAGAVAGETSTAFASGAMTALAAWRVRRNLRARRNAAIAASPVGWLLRIEKDLRPRTLVGRLRDVACRFLGQGAGQANR